MCLICQDSFNIIWTTFELWTSGLAGSRLNHCTIWSVFLFIHYMFFMHLKQFRAVYEKPAGLCQWNPAGRWHPHLASQLFQAEQFILRLQSPPTTSSINPSQLFMFALSFLGLQNLKIVDRKLLKNYDEDGQLMNS
jgi:hypothetical protein